MNERKKKILLIFIVRPLLVILSVLLATLLVEGLLDLSNIQNLSFLQRFINMSHVENQDKVWTNLLRDQQISSSSFNIYYFGESTMQGQPFNNTIPILIEKELNSTLNGKQIRWVNFGSPGISFEETQKRIQWIVDNQKSTFPSLVVIYSGHNEFVPFSTFVGFTVTKNYNKQLNWLLSHSQIARILAELLRVYRLTIDERSYFDVPLFSLPQYEEVLQKYSDEVTTVIQLLSNKQIPVIISTVASNYANFEPNRSVFCENVQNKEAFKQRMEEGRQNDESHEPAKAIEAYIQSVQICNDFAETHYRLGKAYEVVGKYDDAKREYENTLDLDRLPIRAMSRQNNFIRNLPQNDNVQVVDTVKILESHAKNGLIDSTLMIDGHHPNLVGYIIISDALTKKIVNMFHDTREVEPVSQKLAEDIFLYSNKEWSSMYISEAAWFIRLATWRFDPSERLSTASEYLDKAFTYDPNDVRFYQYKMTINYLLFNGKAANEYYKKAVMKDVISTSMYIKEPWIQQVILRASLGK